MQNSTQSILQHIDPDKYEELVRYLKYASSAYSPICPRPNGNKLILQISNPLSDMQGFVARDDTKKEIVVSLRGSASLTDVLLDTQVVLAPFISPGVKLPAGIRVHTGFLIAWDSVALEIIVVLSQQHKQHPDFAIVTTGHSMGGSVALLGAVALKKHFPESEIRTYSYGSPRAGNELFAKYVNETFGANAHRVVHTNDGVPTMIPTLLGYHHHGVEYWQHEDPSSEKTTLECSGEGEDIRCSASVPSKGINSAHALYFGIHVTTPFCI